MFKRLPENWTTQSDSRIAGVDEHLIFNPLYVSCSRSDATSGTWRRANFAQGGLSTLILASFTPQ